MVGEGERLREMTNTFAVISKNPNTEWWSDPQAQYEWRSEKNTEICPWGRQGLAHKKGLYWAIAWSSKLMKLFTIKVKAKQIRLNVGYSQDPLLSWGKLNGKHKMNWHNHVPLNFCKVYLSDLSHWIFIVIL